MLDPRAPERERCVTIVAERLSSLSTGDALVGRADDGGPRIRWSLIAADLDRKLIPSLWRRFQEAGLIPPPPGEGIERCFRIHHTCATCHGDGERRDFKTSRRGPCDVCQGKGRWEARSNCPRPSSLRACAAFASDPAGILRAEQLAALAVERLRPWSYVRRRRYRPSEEAAYPPLTRVTWRTVRPGDEVVPSRATPCVAGLVVDATSRACKDAGIAVAGLPKDSHGAFYLQWGTTPASPEIDRAGHEAWRTLAARGARIPRNGMSNPLPPGLATIGLPFAEVADPFEPLSGILDLGYLLEELAPGVAYLVAPEPA